VVGKLRCEPKGQLSMHASRIRTPSGSQYNAYNTDTALTQRQPLIVAKRGNCFNKLSQQLTSTDTEALLSNILHYTASSQRTICSCTERVFLDPAPPERPPRPSPLPSLS
jgi:hypothetical protein